MRRAHDPARLGGGRLRRCAQPQHQRGDPALACGQCQLAACDKIERTRLAPHLGNDGAERVAGKTVGGGTQYNFRRRRTHDYQVPRIETELRKTAHGEITGFQRGEILPDPENETLALRDPPRQPEGKARGCRRLSAGRKHLMHRAERDPALQRGIDAGSPQRIARKHPLAPAGLQPLHFVA